MKYLVINCFSSVQPYGGYRPPPEAYHRASLNWTDAYDRHRPFVAPYGAPPDVVHRMYRASEAFRFCDRDSGNLNFNEFKNAMARLGTLFSSDFDCIFAMVDTDRSGRMNERMCYLYPF